MHIVLLTGSPHRKGTSALLAGRFAEGVKTAGRHSIYRFDAAFEKVNYCLGCDRCKTGEAPCVHQDAMTELAPQLLEADLIVFATPLYYHDMSAQLKTVLDRFHGINEPLRSRKRQAILMVTAFQPGRWVMEGILAHYKTTLSYMGWEDRGQILALGCDKREDIENSNYPEQAYQLGLSL